ncbi:MAG: glucose-1-phosphate thymidylyltransferase, partial [Flavobacteriales bacterium]
TRFDFAMLTKGKVSGAVHESVTIIGDTSQLFLEEGAVVTASIINTQSGTVYLGKDSEVMEGCMIRGPFSLGEHAQLKMGTKIYVSTNVGPHCKVGGEVSNSVFWGYSNKAHDGFVGNSVLGQWCNLGADTNTSNLKNNYGKVKTWSVQQEQYIDTGLTFCGLLMGDHSKCGINTMFNTGTVTGVCANIFGGDFPEKWIPSFSWGGPQGMVKYRLEEALETAAAVMGRRNLPLTEADRSLLTHLHHNAR